MLPPKIAIIGSADPTRNVTRDNPNPFFPYEPPVDTDKTGLARHSVWVVEIQRFVVMAGWLQPPTRKPDESRLRSSIDILDAPVIADCWLD